MTNLFTLKLSLVIITTLLCFNQLKAQENQGCISGKVVDRSNTIIVNATIKITLLNQNSVQRKTTSNIDGSYQITNLAAGVYTIKIWHAGYKQFYRKKIKIKKGNKELNIKLKKTPSVKLGLP